MKDKISSKKILVVIVLAAALPVAVLLVGQVTRWLSRALTVPVEVYFSPAQVTVPPNTLVTLRLNARGQGIDAVAVRVNYERERLMFVGFLGDGVSPLEKEIIRSGGEGEVRLVLGRNPGETAPNGDFALAQLMFARRSEFSEPNVASELSLSDIQVVNSQSQELDYTVREGTIIINPGGATTTRAPSPTGAAGGNMVNNWDFENGNLSGFDGSGASVVQAAAHEGQYGVVLGRNDAFVAQMISGRLRSGEAYVVSVWVRVEDEGGSWGSPRLRCSRFNDLGTNDCGEALAVDSTREGWQRLEFLRTFSAEELERGVYVGVKNFGMPGVAWVDELSVRASEGGSGGNLPARAEEGRPEVEPTPRTCRLKFSRWCLWR